MSLQHEAIHDSDLGHWLSYTANAVVSTVTSSATNLIEIVRQHPMVATTTGIASIWALYNYYTLRPVYYDFNKICGQFDDKNLDVDPYYFNPKDFDWVPEVESQWRIIRKELDDYLDGQVLEPYFGDNLMSRKQCWRVLGLKFWGLDHADNQKYFPKTMEIMNKIPGLSLVAFSQIEAGGAITPHNGDTNANVRCHMGLVVPGKLPEIGFQVGNEKRNWEEGKVFRFTLYNAPYILLLLLFICVCLLAAFYLYAEE